MEAEKVVGEWRRSVWTLGFWVRTITSVGIYWLILWRRNCITVTTRRVTQRRGGIIGGDETTISLDNITDISVTTPPLGAIFNHGDVSIQSAGSGAAEIAFKGLGGASKLREVIFDLKDGKYDEAR